MLAIRYFGFWDMDARRKRGIFLGFLQKNCAVTRNQAVLCGVCQNLLLDFLTLRYNGVPLKHLNGLLFVLLKPLTGRDPANCVPRIVPSQVLFKSRKAVIIFHCTR
ncbi:MAG: hypothetical protein DDG60_06080 [Anaerolineae bacterium]|nr:MAG: hypothetical protein DDG60_06080 [Anaerolineae bacterium]